jgi:hypothetical protein
VLQVELSNSGILKRLRVRLTFPALGSHIISTH